MPVISVIIPVYNAEKTLPACVESVLAQTFQDWELLLIDDGSRDASGALCDALASRDDRIRAFHQANGGVSSARNLGLSRAAGEWIAFLDADDGYESRCLETLWNAREQARADSAVCAHMNVWPNGKEEPERALPDGVYDRQGILEHIVYPLLGDRLTQPVFNGFIWRYLYSADIIRRCAIAFAGAYLEDELFLLEYFCNARRLVAVGEPLYRYCYNPASATHRYMPDFSEVFGRFMERKEELAGRYGLDAARPLWRENTNWAGLLIAVGNEFAPGSGKSAAERRKAVEVLCARPDMVRAVSAVAPTGLSRNKQLVARLIRSGRFGLLTWMYRVKNRL